MTAIISSANCDIEEHTEDEIESPMAFPISIASESRSSHLVTLEDHLRTVFQVGAAAEPLVADFTERVLGCFVLDAALIALCLLELIIGKFVAHLFWSQ